MTMAVLRMKPFTLARYVSSAGYENDNGDYVAGGGEWVEAGHCDAVPAGKAEERTFEDGVARAYSYTVYLPAESDDYTIGDRVRIKMRRGVEREFTVKGFHRYRLQCKMWV